MKNGTLKKIGLIPIIIVIGLLGCTEEVTNITKNSGPDNRGPINVSSGTTDGGGGRVVVCRHSDGEIKSVELLDLYEARVQFKRKVKKSRKSVRKQINTGISFLPKWSPSQNNSHNYYNGLFQGKHFDVAINIFKNMSLIQNVHLVSTNDSFEAIYPRGCYVEQLGVYQPDSSGKIDESPIKGTLLVDKLLFNKLDKTNKAAFILHEAIYSELRKNFGDINSIRTRRVIGKLFSGEKIKSIVPPLEDKVDFRCQGGTPKTHDDFYSNLHFFAKPVKRTKDQNRKSICYNLYLVKAGRRHMISETVHTLCAIGHTPQELFIKKKTGKITFGVSSSPKLLISEFDNFWNLGVGIQSVTNTNDELMLEKIVRWVDVEVNGSFEAIDFTCYKIDNSGD